tara:strand:- start:67053 stop:68654 length:1602 start_codon:yes stop_codon:yes gene_type:complete
MGKSITQNVYGFNREESIEMRKLSVWVLSLFLLSISNQANAAAAEPYEDGLCPTARYAKAVECRKNGDLDEAIKLFEPLLESGDSSLQQKSMHNLGSCYHRMGNQQKAYFWFKEAASQGFAPSKRNLEKLDLLNVFLPPEILRNVISFLPVSSMAVFAGTSQRNYHATGEVLSKVDFLTFKDPTVEGLFEGTEVTPAPKALRLSRNKKIKGSSVEIHFRDTAHLRRIATEFSQVSVSDNIYYVYDAEVKDGEEFQADDGNVTKSEWFFRYESDDPLVMIGTLDLPISLSLPRGSNTDGLEANIRRGMSTGELSEYVNGHELADTLDEFDRALFHARTASAGALLDERVRHRAEYPHLYPSLMDRCPEVLVISSGDSYTKTQGDYIDSEGLLFHMAPSREEMGDLLSAYPELGQSILCINCRADDGFVGSGIYAKKPLKLTKYYSIKSSEDLVISGAIEIDDASLMIESKRDAYFLNHFIRIGHLMKMKGSGGSIKMIGRLHPSQLTVDGVPQQYWDFVRAWMLHRGRAEIRLS